MPEVKKKKSKTISTKDGEIELIKLMKDFIAILEDSHDIFTKDMTNSMMDTFADVLSDNTEFRKILANPKSDLAEFEPVIKRMIKKKKHV